MDNMRGRTRGRRPGTRARGRPKKNIEHNKDESTLIQNIKNEKEELPSVVSEITPDSQTITKIDMEADISQLEAPTFTTIKRGPPEAMLKLQWGHPVNLLGEKVLNPLIHCCDQCLHPVLIYGRMMPCKHVLCLSCAKAQSSECPRCKETLTRVEETGLGSLYMCTHGGTRYGNNGCGRTYLSVRDLQAHTIHRHVGMQGENHIKHQFPLLHDSQKVNEIRNKPEVQPPTVTAPTFYDNEKPKIFDETECLNYVSSRSRETNNALTRSSNLITVPLQGQSQDPYYLSYNTVSGYYPPSYQEYAPPPPTQADLTVPPPQQWANNQQFYG